MFQLCAIYDVVFTAGDAHTCDALTPMGYIAAGMLKTFYGSHLD